jgi:hypothetical protein
MLCSMTPLLTADTLALLADEVESGLENPAYGDYCIQSASVLVADAAGRPDWLGIAADGAEMTPNLAPRRAVMIAEQLAKRSYLNPNAVVQEGSIGPIGGDRTIEDFARTFEFTEVEAAYLAEVKRTTGIVDTGSAGTGLWTLEMEVRPYGADWATIFLPDLDPRAAPWPVGVEGNSYGAYGVA